MELKDKIILVYYLDIRYINSSDVNQYLFDFYEKIKEENDDSVYQIIIPVREASRVECINPKLISEDEYKKVEELIIKNKDFLLSIKK